MAFTTIIAKQSRTAGTYTSPSQTVQPAVNQIFLRAVMDAADLVNPAVSVTVVIQRSLDGGTTWRDYAQLDWTGFAGNTRVPGMIIPGPAGGASFLARGTVTLGQTISIGAEVEVS